MKNILVASVLLALTAVSVHGQGTIFFFNNGGTRISTNAVIGGAATGQTETGAGLYYYALFYSTTEPGVNGLTNSISGSTNNNYAFNDSQWTLAAYGTNTTSPGRFISAIPDGSGETAVAGVAGGTSAYFVVIGWSANIGTNIAAVQNWFGLGDPDFPGWIGQSVVSGPLVLGISGETVPSSLFGLSPPFVPGFTLGLSSDLPVFLPPYIVLQPTNVTVSVGANASFSVSASGYPVPTYQWMYGSNAIPGATGSTLTISDVQLTNAGSYFVLITNISGSTNSYAATLTVQPGGPLITGQPTNVTVQIGNNATFAAAVSGSLPLNYQWNFNNNIIAGATNATLTLSDVQTNNAGNYAVTITNSYGSTNSSAAVLTVEAIPPIITAQPASLTVLAGDSATFTAIANGSTPLYYQWSFNNTNLTGATSASLMLLNVQANNAGSYAVAISNLCGITNSIAATLAVTSGQNSADVIFANNNNSLTKIYTNSSVGGSATGLTVGVASLYYYALFVSATATNVNGRTSAIVGADGTDYAFNDTNWTLVAYGASLANPFRGRFVSLSTDDVGSTPVPGFGNGAVVQFVVIGWSASIGADIPSVEGWFNGGSPDSDGWIGQSVVSGPIAIASDELVAPAELFGASAPYIQGFTLGLASPNAAAVYAVPYAPPAILQTKGTGNSVQLSWPTASGSFGVQSASSPAGPWSDTGLTVTTSGTNSMVTIPAGSQGPFFRLVAE